MQRSYLLIFLVCFASCSAPKFYKEIKSTYSHRRSGNDINKRVLKLLETELQQSQHIILFEEYRPAIDFDRDEHNIIVYDVDNDAYYKLKDKDFYKHPDLLETAIKRVDDNYFNFVYKHFIKNECDVLKRVGAELDHSGMRTYHSIYEINLRTGLASKCTFEDIFWTAYEKY